MAITQERLTEIANRMQDIRLSAYNLIRMLAKDGVQSSGYKTLEEAVHSIISRADRDIAKFNKEIDG